jgi:hypothetical protein
MWAPPGANLEFKRMGRPPRACQTGSIGEDDRRRPDQAGDRLLDPPPLDAPIALVGQGGRHHDLMHAHHLDAGGRRRLIGVGQDLTGGSTTRADGGAGVA